MPKIGAVTLQERQAPVRGACPEPTLPMPGPAGPRRAAPCRATPRHVALGDDHHRRWETTIIHRRWETTIIEYPQMIRRSTDKACQSCAVM
jgi:hypothetical protein